MKHWYCLGFAVIILTLSGCTSFGPTTVAQDRFDYNAAISDSWKEQTLLNIVKIRYADTPLFVEVASVVNGYTLEGSVNFGGTFPTDSSTDVLTLGTSGKYTDRPTITYTPITGQQFNKNFMTPIPPGSILFLMQSGWPADLIIPVTIDSINGHQSARASGSNLRRGNPEYYRIIELIRSIQKSNAVGMHLVKEGDTSEAAIMFFMRDRVPETVKADMDELNHLLGLRNNIKQADVSYGLLPKTDSEISMLTRSLLQIMIKLASQIDVPEAHIADGRTVPSLGKDKLAGNDAGLLNIHHSKEKPVYAFTAVRYRDYWFWIDDRDFKSKRTFAFLMILFSLMETGAREGLPLVTIPAG
jgi:hypothetical protein